MKDTQIPPEKKQKIIDFDERFLPGLAIDTVIFGFNENNLKILLLEYQHTNLFALPGGFIQKDESLNDAAKRVLSERTGLQNIYLDQFYVFGDLARQDPKPLQQIMIAKGMIPIENHWLLGRFITVGYYALIDYTKAIPIADILSDSCEWYDLNKLPPLMLDHKVIVEKALATLKANLDNKLTGLNLMPETFTMADLQSLYETVLGEKLLRTSFHRKMLNLGILEKTAKKWTGSANKAPFLYRFTVTTN